MITNNNEIYSLILKDINRNTSGVYTIINDRQSDVYSELLYNSHCKFFHSYSNTISWEPFNPFLSIIKKFFPTEAELNELFNSVNLYPTHRDLIKSYLFTGIATRIEPILPFDYSYEESRFYDGLYKILNYIGKEVPFTLMLESFNLAPYSTLKWIQWLILNHKDYNFKIILIIDNYNYIVPRFQDIFDDLLQYLELQDANLELSKPINCNKIANNSLDIDSINWLTIADNYYHLFTLEHCIHFYKKYLSSLMCTNNPLEHEKYCSVMVKLGEVYCLLKEYSLASEHFNILQSYALDFGLEQYNLIAIQKLTIINILTQNFKAAEALAKQSFKLAKQLNIDRYLIESYNILFWINEKAKYRTTISKYKFEEDFIRLTTKYSYNNMLAYFLTHTFNSISYAKPEDQHTQYNLKGHDIARMLDNQNCILSAYLKTALVYAVRGYYSTSILYYKKVEPLLLESKDYFRLAQTYNGIGYYYLVNENYKEASKYYSKALKCLKICPNFDEICMTLLNSGLNYFLTSNYSLAENSFNILLLVMSELNLDRLRLTTKSRILGIISLNHYYQGNIYKAYSSLSKMKLNSLDSTITVSKDDDDEFFLFNFMQGLLSSHEEKYTIASSYFKKANYYALKLEGSLKCLYPKFLNEYIKVLKFQNDNETAQCLYEKAIAFCKKNDLQYSLSLFESYGPSQLSISEEYDNLNWILDSTKNQAAINNLNNKINEINFLNVFQENLSTQNDFNKAIESSMTLLKSNFSLDGYLICLFPNVDEKHIFYSSINRDIIDTNFLNIYNLVKTNPNTLVFSKDDKTNDSNFIEVFTKIISCPIYSLIHIPIIKNNTILGSYICFTTDTLKLFNNANKLNSDLLRIIDISIKQLFETITRIYGQKKLLETAHTDMLTGLDNRQSFYSKLSNIVNSNELKTNTLILFYIDLDNFKYYNDTFGHKIGDSILIWFGELLKASIPSSINPIRYGGDEFLILLTDYTKAQVVHIANTIFNKLSTAHGFTNEISKELKTSVDIPKEKYLSCSMGIVLANLTHNFNIPDFIDSADNAMYKAKKLGKHRYVIY